MSSLRQVGAEVGLAILIGIVLAAAIPMIAGTIQLALAVVHGIRNHYARTGPYTPRTAVLIPAWNEAAVLAVSIDRLMGLDYPPEALRVYVVDDASTDATPAVVRDKEGRYPGRVVHLRREHGGQGKAHTLNHGLAVVLDDDWAQAVLIMDADVVYQPDSLRRMASHLADPAVGSVTAYITEGSRPGNYLTRFIGYEYITAQAAARRGQNVLGVLACLAGGAQLHRREALERIGGQIDTTSLAEDTVTTFNVQLTGYQVIFEPYAVVRAEEPPRVTGLWKQRLRWARGNLQVTRRFHDLWFGRYRPGWPQQGNGRRLGGFWFGVIWFSLLVQPILMVAASASLLILWLTTDAVAARVFSALWITNAVTYVFITAMSLALDPPTARRVWPQAILFPGIVSLAIMVDRVFPPLFDGPVRRLLGAIGWRVTPGQENLFIVLAYLWLAACMGVAYLAVRVEPHSRWLATTLIYVGGYGPLLCAVTFAAYVKEVRHAELTWDKTEKVGAMGS